MSALQMSMHHSRILSRDTMQSSHFNWQSIQPFVRKRFETFTPRQRWICTQCLRRSPFKPSTLLRQQRRHQSNPADSPDFQSIVDSPAKLVRQNRRHRPVGVIILATIPITSFLLGCWQVQRLGWKTDLIAKFEDRLIREPLPLPPVVDPDAVKEFDYRRVLATGRFRHDQEMLIGPRLHDGNDGYLVITPLDRTQEFPNSKSNTSILVNRGWIPKSKAAQSSRPGGLPTNEITVEGLLREPWKRNMFTPVNKPGESKWFFPDVFEMAGHAGTQAIWVEETMKPDLLASYEREDKGIPIGRPPEVNLRNNHTQYIFTWYSLSLATTIMLWMVLKRPQGGIARRVRQNKEW